MLGKWRSRTNKLWLANSYVQIHTNIKQEQTICGSTNTHTQIHINIKQSIHRDEDTMICVVWQNYLRPPKKLPERKPKSQNNWTEGVWLGKARSSLALLLNRNPCWLSTSESVKPQMDHENLTHHHETVRSARWVSRWFSKIHVYLDTLEVEIFFFFGFRDALEVVSDINEEGK